MHGLAPGEGGRGSGFLLAGQARQHNWKRKQDRYISCKWSVRLRQCSAGDAAVTWFMETELVLQLHHPRHHKNVWDCSWWVPGNTIYWNSSISVAAEKQLCVLRITEFKGSKDVIAGSYYGIFFALIKDSCLLCYGQEPGLNRSLVPFRCTAKQSCL